MFQYYQLNQIERLSERLTKLLFNLASMVFVFSLLGLQASFAEDSPSDRDFDKRIYIGGELGASQLDPRTSKTGFHVDDDSSNTGTLFLGYDLSRRWSMEVYVASLGEAGISRDTDNVHVGVIDYTNIGLSGIFYFLNSRNAVDYQHGFDDEGFFRREGLSTYARVGLGKQDTDSNTVQFVQLEDVELHFGLGLEYGWANGIAARAEFTSFDQDSKAIEFGLLKRFGKASPYSLPGKSKIVAGKAKPTFPPAPKPPAKAVGVTLPMVYFPFDKSHLTGVSKAILDSFIADVLRPDPRLRLGVFGHTDAYGTESYNQRLSEKRAETVKAYLESNGVSGDRLETKGFGEQMPKSGNDTEEDRALNRRVEFEVLK